eukprot:s8379_g2.t1
MSKASSVQSQGYLGGFMEWLAKPFPDDEGGTEGARFARETEAGIVVPRSGSQDHLVMKDFGFMCHEAEFLDGEHVLFGEVLEGKDVVLAIETCATQSGDPSQSIVWYVRSLVPFACAATRCRCAASGESAFEAGAATPDL